MMDAHVSCLDVTRLESGGLAAAVKALLRPNTRVVIINAPHNPTGWLPTSIEYAALVQLVAEHDIWLFSDEMYRW